MLVEIALNYNYGNETQRSNYFFYVEDGLNYAVLLHMYMKPVKQFKTVT